MTQGGRRVLLINPRACKTHKARLPLSLLSLAAVLDARHQVHILDANIDPAPIETAHRLIERDGIDAIGVTVMPGPQVADAVAISATLRAEHPTIPIVWGGYFPTLYTRAAINAPYVDALVRGEGEDTFVELLDRVDDLRAAPRADASSPLRAIAGLTWKHADGVAHNPPRHARSLSDQPPLPYHLLHHGDLAPYHHRTFLGGRTSVHQAATGCRFQCNFCGVAAAYGKTALEPPARLHAHLTHLRDAHGVTSMMYYDNNFFDTEATSQPMLDVLASMEMPYWCYGRADTLARFSAETWKLVERSRLRMIYIGAESPDEERLKAMRKGTRAEYTVEAAIRCREHGVVPELSFILGGPNEPEADIERTFDYIRQIKRRVPESEIILYYYTPMPQRDTRANHDGFDGPEVIDAGTYGPGGPPLPSTPEGWADPQWVRYSCHADAPWLTPRVRRRVDDFARVLACRFPTMQDINTPRWGKRLLSTLARWRYASRCYSNPVELAWLHARLRLKVPQVESL